MRTAGTATPVPEAVDIEEATVETAGPPLNRMVMALAGLIGIIIAIYMSLYKLGVIPAVACGTGACEAVQASRFAVFMGVPVPVWGVLGYGGITALAMWGLRPDRIADRWVAGALLLFSAVAFVFSAYLSWLEQYVIQAWCRWCIGSAVVATILFLAALPEVAVLRRRADAA